MLSILYNIVIAANFVIGARYIDDVSAAGRRLINTHSRARELATAHHKLCSEYKSCLTSNSPQ